ncbi:spore cortex-lytic enzyme [Desulforamulus hydrothermalis]|uniref:Spore cortex-lytic enzyme n=1 Tax=Desulforamulus hydrothermalis Lam5 = DSM 18033 TaxID=1121428 RepID=K8DZB2_9FIRM|nr:Cell wall hydrolase, SleB [Desulforamulus hydrothermalis Lam5 = DSM 18033]SHH14426.1 N-acetylmuramoyl-L-alanine amidase [Desulforamulus hydrothermalis Lam5 = DSM 18033]
MLWGSMQNKRRIGIALISLIFFCLGGLLFYSRALAQDTLYWGTGGSKVRAVQQRLKDWGYYNGPVNGYYSGQTVAAVRKFQARNGLRVDGVVGPQTYQALGLYTPPKKTTYTATTSRGFVSNRDTVNLLARVIMGEAADEPYIGKVAVGAVMLNRMKNSQFPNTLAGVIYQPLAFESVANGQYNRPLSQEALRAAQDALAGYDPTGGALFFWNPGKPVSRWIWSRRIVTQIGNHVFAH